ncbi:NAD(P)H-binding protein [Nonomuraea zeae]|uniref:SDR family NAD(P)-dependent oxidoreductase n=1 Tax=Nonomuraea zeae TaxID=1642303 RepID=A0A5S4GF90_9ACTN|nr:NAD(P)H-binding protein [Nonomuraea zeae]TMR31647.1 SDR family NAD(P)-dependent oxidoreductase [Nonomuraea zeae]
MTAEPIVVVGATGKVGRRITTRLRERGLDVRPASRRGPTRFDWYDPATWAPAVSGASAAFLIDSQGADAPAQLRAFGEVASAHGVRRLVLLSSRDWATSGGEESLASERAVQESGAGWTILRPTWFGQNFSEDPLLSDPIMAGEVVLPTGDGVEPFIDAEDIADVAVATLVEPGHAEQIYELSGPRLLSFGTAVAEIARASGRDIAYLPVSPDEYAAHLAGRGEEGEHVELLNTLFGWIRDGHNAHLSDGVRRVLGREPRDFTDYVRATAASGVWTP